METIAKTPIFDLVRGDEVQPGFRPVKIVSRDWVTIIVRKDNLLLMEKQLRYGTDSEYEELPCGIVELGEKTSEAAYRELLEETGIKLKNPDKDLKYLGKFAANPAFMTNYMNYYYVDLSKAEHENVGTSFDEHEDIVSYWKDINSAYGDYVKSTGSVIMSGVWLLMINNGLFGKFSI